MLSRLGLSLAAVLFSVPGLAAGLNEQIPFQAVDELNVPSIDRRPNIVFILTDDQDLHMQSLDYLPYVKKHLIERGTLYKRHFCTTALCCPSRVSLWSGKAAHNTNVTDVNPPYGLYWSESIRNCRV